MIYQATDTLSQKLDFLAASCQPPIDTTQFVTHLLEAATAHVTLDVIPSIPEPSPAGPLLQLPTVSSTPQGEGSPSPTQTQTLREYQRDVVDDALEFVAHWERRIEAIELGKEPTAEPQEFRRLYSSPTGTGKGTIILALADELRSLGYNVYVVTPSLEVIRGFLQRQGFEVPDGAEKLADAGYEIGVTTPVRLARRISHGEEGWETPDILIVDEAHHATTTNTVSGTLFDLSPEGVFIGFTATPFRGTPRGTAQLREDWGEPTLVMTIPEAIQDNWWALPRFRIVPLLDDDKVKIQAGRFVTGGKTGTESVFRSRISDLAQLASTEATSDHKPTVVFVPSTAVAEELCHAIEMIGDIEALPVLQYTKAKERKHAYAKCLSGEAVLVTIKVISEGFDMPELHRIIDARPTLSPVSWLQVIGRCTRPKKDGSRPEVLVCCRNIERHAYLLQGAFPPEIFKEAQEAFEKPTQRAAARSLGLESLGRFKPIVLPLSDGTKGFMYALYNSDEDGVVTEYVTLVYPTEEDPVCATRRNVPDPTAPTITTPAGKTVYPKKWGTYGPCAVPDEITGYRTSQFRGKLTDKQRAWWIRDARKYGLDADAADTLTMRQFSALPVLAALRRKR